MSAPRALAIGAALLLVALGLSLMVGAVPVDPGTVWEAMTRGGDEPAHAIVRDLRLPRALLAALLGGALGIAGGSLQATLRNPLAEPWLLGVSGGAAVGAVIAASAGARGLGVISLCAFGGALAAVSVVLALARGGSTERLLMAGVVAGAFANAAIMVLLADAGPTAQRSALWWMMGSVAVAQWRDVAWLAGALGVAGGVLLHEARQLDLLMLGADTAASLGVDPERAVRRTFVLASLLAAATVATAGLVGFVGLLVPHVARRVVRGGGARGTLVVAAVAGAVLVVLADLLARTVRPPSELPLGAVTALFGVPFLLLLLRRTR